VISERGTTELVDLHLAPNACIEVSTNHYSIFLLPMLNIHRQGTQVVSNSAWLRVGEIGRTYALTKHKRVLPRLALQSDPCGLIKLALSNAAA
jgi:hypothetical protein